LKKKIKKKNYNSEVFKIIFLFYIKNTPRSGKSFLGTNLIKLVLFIITQNSINKNWSINRIIIKVCKKIKNNNFNSIKSIIKPGLTNANKAKRLA
jgi:hypothetical protein